MELTAAVCEGFINSCLISKYDEATPLEDFHREWLQLCCNEAKMVAIAAPRGHSKSTTVTFGYLLANLLFRKAKYALIVSATFSQAGQFLGDLKKEMQTNDEIHGLFGNIEFVKDTEDDIIIKFEDGATARIQARGAEQKLRGLKWLNMRPDLIICDDMEEDESVLNRDRREKFRRWFYSALIPCMSVSGRLRIVGTILHLDSLLERLMPEQQLNAKGSKNLKFLVREDLREYSSVKLPWLSAKYRAHTDDFKSILWPSRWSAEDFKNKQAEYRSQGLSDAYSQEFLNVPLDESTAFFKKADFLPIRDEDKKLKLNYYIACDLAVSTKQRSDYSVFVVAGVDENNRLHVVNVIRDRIDSMEIVDTMIMLQKLYKPELFGIEQGAIEKAIGPYLRQAMLEKDVFMNISLMRPSADKVTRARSIQARMRAGAVKFDKMAEWYDAFEAEAMQFPRAKHDDQVDALSYVGLLLDTMITAPTAQEQEDEEYALALHEHGYDTAGRDSTTGY